MRAVSSQSLPENDLVHASRSLAKRLMQAAFAAFLVLTLATPSWRTGPFTWLPLWRSPMLGGRPAQLGVLSLLPLLVTVIWVCVRVVERPQRAWRWGKIGNTLPLIGLSLLVLIGLEATLTWRSIVQVVGVGLTWFVFLFVLNEEPDLAVPLAAVILIQGSVAVGQFLNQSDLGLRELGELPLDPTVRGITVLWSGEQRWLRAYGLTSHPNVLGATLTVLFLLRLRPLIAARGWQRMGPTLVASVGVSGLLTSFSRASWLALAVGLSAWVILTARQTRATRCDWWDELRGWLRPSDLPFQVIFPFILAGMFVLVNRDLITSRFVNLDTPIEAHSLDERRRDTDLALTVIASRPLSGVGAGNYLTAVREIEPDSRPVHNVPLLVTAELGLLGAALWMWLMASELRAHPVVLAPWLAMLVIGMFDNTLWLTTSWRAAILLGLLIGQASRFRRH